MKSTEEECNYEYIVLITKKSDILVSNAFCYKCQLVLTDRQRTVEQNCLENKITLKCIY